MSEIISLNGEWSLAFAPEIGVMPRDTDELSKSGFRVIPAKVPGNVELDLINAGIEDNLYFGLSPLNFRKYEFHAWYFERDFIIPEGFLQEETLLRLDGIDTFADVFINGVFFLQYNWGYVGKFNFKSH